MASGAEYLSLSEKYTANAYKAIGDGELEKAGEFLWGSYAEALKAAAATKGITLRTHRLIREFAAQLSKETGDNDYWDVLAVAEGLYANFYESELTDRDLIIGRERILDTVTKLTNLMRGRANSKDS